VTIWSTIRGYLEICRISNLPTVWTNVLCAFVLASGGFSWQGFLVPALSLSCYYLAGMCLNDVCDAAYDRIHRPARPIPSGRVSHQGALLLTAFLFASGSALLLAVPYRQTFYAALLLITVIVWYDLRHKQNPFSVLLMASCRFLVFAVTSLSISGSIASPVLLAGLLQSAYVVCISLVARYENSRTAPFTLQVIPLMLAGICLLDGMILALYIHPVWLLTGFAGAFLMLAGQKLIKGD